MMYAYSEALLKSIRAYQRYAGGRSLFHKLMRKAARLRHLFWSMVTASDIDAMTQIGDGTRLPHPNGVIFHRDAAIGRDCMIMQQVTVGMIGEGQVPTIGDGVYIGAGAKILGDVKVGNGARIGAMAVVLEDVPAHCTAVGNPARIIGRSPTIVRAITG